MGMFDFFDPERLKYMIFHDTGTPTAGANNPYTLRFTEQPGAYPLIEQGRGQHAVDYNRIAPGFALTGEVGSMPREPQTMTGMAREVERANLLSGRVSPLPSMGHGEADALYKSGQSNLQATATARDPSEANWSNYANAFHDRSATGIDPTGADIRFKYDPATGANNINDFGMPMTPRVPVGARSPTAPLGVPTTPQDFEERRKRLYAREQTGPTPAEMLLGPTAGGYLGNLVKNPAFMGGLFEIGKRGEIGLGITGQYAEERQREFNRAAAADKNEIDWRKYTIEAAKEGREATDWLRTEKTRQERDKIWAQANPNGVPDPSHPLYKGLTPDEIAAAQGLGSEAGFAELAKMRFMTAEARAKAQLLREQKRQDFADFQAATRGGQPQAPAAAGGAPTQGPAMGPAGAPPLGTSPPAAPTAGGAGYLAQPPAIAPAAPAPGAPPPAGGGAMLPLRGMPGAPTQLPPYGQFDPYAMGEIAAHTFLGEGAAKAANESGKFYRELQAAGPKQYATTSATEEAKQQAEKPKVREQVSTTLDSLDMTRALATKVMNDKALPKALGITSTGIAINKFFSAETRDVAANLDNLISRQALDTMARLKQQSSTGATGFGSTNEAELNIIQGALTNLKDKSQSPEQYRQNLQTLITALDNAERRMLVNWQETYREPFSTGAKMQSYPSEKAPTEKRSPRGNRPPPDTGNAAFLAPPKVGERRNGRPYLGGDPKKEESWGPRD